MALAESDHEIRDVCGDAATQPEVDMAEMGQLVAMDARPEPISPLGVVPLRPFVHERQTDVAAGFVEVLFDEERTFRKADVLERIGRVDALEQRCGGGTSPDEYLRRVGMGLRFLRSI